VTDDGRRERDRLKAALERLAQLEQRQQATEAARSAPIAVIGMGCRFPGGAGSPDAYWQMLLDGVDTVGPIPKDRWDAEALYDPNPDAPGKIATRGGAFLSDIDRFDARFFDILPREAIAMDPQQRMLLEVAWEALEYAGYPPGRARGSAVGVFVGIASNNYGQITATRLDDAYAGLGSTFSAAPGRISYALGLDGPCFAVDTACASSLATVHLACQALRNGECAMALAGGVNAILTPYGYLFLSRTKVLSPDGRCKPFSASADGIGRGEGCGLVVLKRLADAVADGDTVHAVIRASAVQQDGRSGGLTVPNGRAQERLIRDVLKAAQVKPSEVGFVETHGTGTELGDPIEAEALVAALGPERPADRPLVLGAVKSNIAHLESAAGIAGLIKTVLVLRHGRIPRNLHFAGLNPRIAFGAIPVLLPAETVPFPAVYPRRLAGVSAFGLTGIIAHILLEAAPEPPPRVAAPGPLLLPLSARSEAELAELAGRYRDHLACHPEQQAADICFTAAAGRSHFAFRRAVVAEDRDALAAELAAPRAASSSRRAPRAAFLFTGQGAQYAGMASGLAAREPAFRAALERCDRLFAKIAPAGPSLLSVMLSSEHAALIDETGYTQPALYALGVALSELWRLFGVEPVAVLGHSVGEIAGATVAGALSVEDGLRFAAERGRLMQALPRDGAMAVVFAEPAEVAQAIAGEGGRVAIAAFNGPRETVISGGRVAIAAITAKLTAAGTRCRALVTSHAFHSTFMEPMLEELERVAKSLAWSAPKIDFVSTLSGEPVTPGLLKSPRYWRDQARAPVRFVQAMQRLLDLEVDCCVEIGPQPMLIGLGRRCLPDPDRLTWLPSLRRDRDDPRQMYESLVALYERGAKVDWASFHAARPGRRLPLPTYPFARRRYWVDAAPRAAAGAAPAGLHPVLGSRLRSPLPEIQFQAEIAPRWLPLLDQHRVAGAPVMPAAAWIEAALAAARLALDLPRPVLRGLALRAPLRVAPDGSAHLQTIVTREPGGGAALRFYAAAGEAWSEIASAAVEPYAAAPSPAALAPVRARCAAAQSTHAVYAGVEAQGIDLGPMFQGIEALWAAEGEQLGRIAVPAEVASEAGAYAIHPALLDAAMQVGAALLPAPSAADRVFLPVGADRIALLGEAGNGAVFFSHAVQRGSTGASATVDLTLFDESGAAILVVESLRFQAVAPVSLAKSAAPDQGAAYEIVWTKAPRTGADERPGRFLLCAAEDDAAAPALTAALRAAGQDCVSRAAVEGLTDAEDLRGVLHLPDPRSSAEARCVALLATIQTLARSPAPPRLHVVTRTAQAVVEGDEPAPEEAALWGLAAVAAIEQPAIWGSIADLPRRPSEADFASVAATLAAGDGEDRIAFRHGDRLVPRLRRCAADSGQAPPLRTEASYLITGGLGALGLAVARWLVGQGARHLVLVGRRGPSPAAATAIAELRETFATIVVRSLDVADAAAVEALMGEFGAGLPPLGGVVHAAGVADGCLLAKHRPESLLAVLSPKVCGAQNIAAAARGHRLDFFVFFSSVSGVLGVPGQGAYAAANAFLDGLAMQRRKAGLPGQSLAWGAWAEAGMGKGLGSDRLARAGMTALSSAEGTAWFGRALAWPAAYLAITAQDWRRYGEVLGMVPPFLADLAGAHDPRELFRDRLQRTLPPERPTLVRAHIEEQIRRVISIGAEERLDPHESLFSLGLDSLMAMELTTALKASLSAPLPPTLLFDHPSIDALSTYLTQILAGGPPPREPSTTASAGDADLVERVKNLGQAEIEAAIAEKFRLFTGEGR
jgi:acyl transferase domain-containing protein/acyl carrier protein